MTKLIAFHSMGGGGEESSVHFHCQTILRQAALRLFLIAAFNIDQPQIKVPVSSVSNLGELSGARHSPDFYFVSVAGGSRPPKSQSRLLKQVQLCGKLSVENKYILAMNFLNKNLGLGDQIPFVHDDDADKNLGEETTAIEVFKEAVQCLEAFKLDSAEATLEQKRRSVLDFLQNQLADNSSHAASCPA